MNDMYIVIRGLSVREDGRWYNLTRMDRQNQYETIRMNRRSSTCTSPKEHATAVEAGPPLVLEATGVLEFGQYGGVAEVYRPVRG